MADKKIQISLELQNGQYIAKVREASTTTEKFKKQTTDAARGIGAGFNMMKVAIFAAVAGIAGKLLGLAGEFDDVKSSFEKLTASVEGGSKGLLKAVQIAAKGTVSQLDIMKSSNLAITLMGEEVANYLPKMMDIAAATAKTQGVSVAQMYNDIIVASGRQSVQILDNLGISSVTAGKYMEEYAQKLGKTRMTLDETQKKAAFFYAVMKGGGEISDTVGSKTLTLGQVFQVMKSSMTDIATTFMSAMTPALSDLGNAFIDATKDGGVLMTFFENLGEVIGWALKQMSALIAYMNVNKNLRQAEKYTKDADEVAKTRQEAMQRWGYKNLADLTTKANKGDKQAKADLRDIKGLFETEAEYRKKAKGEYNAAIDTGERIWGGNKKDVEDAVSTREKEKKGKKTVTGGSGGGGGSDAAKKKYEEDQKYLQSFRQASMSEYEIIQDNYNQEMVKFNSITDDKLKKSKEGEAARLAITKKYQDQITDYIISKTQSWLSFGSSALGEISNLYNMASDNKIRKLDEEYAKQVEVINNSVMSEEQKENRLAMLEADYEAKKKREQIRNAKVQKKIALMQAMVDLPAAVIATFRNMGGWPWGAIPAAIMGAIGAKKIQMIKDQPVALAAGGLVTDPTYALLGEGKYPESVLPHSNKTFDALGEGIERARSRNGAASSPNIINNYSINVQGSIIDKEGFNKGVHEGLMNIQQRTGVDVYSRKSVWG